MLDIGCRPTAGVIPGVILSLPEAPALLATVTRDGTAPQDGEGSQDARHMACVSSFEILRRPTPPHHAERRLEYVWRLRQSQDDTRPQLVSRHSTLNIQHLPLSAPPLDYRTNPVTPVRSSAALPTRTASQGTPSRCDGRSPSSSPGFPGLQSRVREATGASRQAAKAHSC